MGLAFHRILAPTDFSRPAETAVYYAYELARQFNAELHLLHVCEDPLLAGRPGVPGGPVPEVGEKRAAILEQLNQPFTLQDRKRVKITAHVVFDRSTGLGIARFAAEEECELIVMGTHGGGPVTDTLMGSVAAEVVRLAPCHVLTIRHPIHRKVAMDRLLETATAAA